MKKLVAAASLAALILTFWASTAAAQGPPVPTVDSGRETGLMLRVGVGLDGCTDDWCDDIDPSVNVRFVGLYRFLKHVAVGVHMAFLFGNPDSNVGDHAWNLFLGLEGRGILPLKQIDLWGALSLGWNRSMTSGDMFIPGLGNIDARTWMNAVALGFGFGGDYFITPNIAVGLNFYLYKPWPQEGCLDTELSDTNCVELEEDTKDDIGIIWSINAMFTYFLPM
jgi:hypothetical protein